MTVSIGNGVSTGNIMTTETNSLTGGSEILVSAGEKLGKISAITYNADGTLATYTQDRVTWTCAYDASGRLSSETSQGSGTVKTYTYNADGTLATVGVV